MVDRNLLLLTCEREDCYFKFINEREGGVFTGFEFLIKY